MTDENAGFSKNALKKKQKAEAKKNPDNDNDNEFSCPLLTRDEYEHVVVPLERLEDPHRGIQAALDEYGFCIVPNVITVERARELEQTLTRELVSMVDVPQTTAAAQQHPSVKQAWERAQRDGLAAWPDYTLKKFGQKNRFQLRGLPHSRFAWACRLEPEVRRVYEVLHQTPDLVSSCDNSFVSGRDNPPQETNRMWPHADQNDHDPTVADWNVYQGLLYLWGSDHTEHASTTVVWPKSHRGLYQDMYMRDPKMAKRGVQGQHFSPLPAAYLDEWRAQVRRCPVPQGGLLLWNSRTTHQGWSGGPRLAQPVCWEPRARRTKAAMYRKYALAALGLPSTHWASLGQPHYLVKQESTAKAVAAQHSSLPSRVVFALKARSVPSAALKEGVSAKKLWEALGSVDLNEPLPKDVRTLLDQSLKKEFKEIL